MANLLFVKSGIGEISPIFFTKVLHEFCLAVFFSAGKISRRQKSTPHLPFCGENYFVQKKVVRETEQKMLGKICFVQHKIFRATHFFARNIIKLARNTVQSPRSGKIWVMLYHWFKSITFSDNKKKKHAPNLQAKGSFLQLFV